MSLLEILCKDPIIFKIDSVIEQGLSCESSRMDFRFTEEELFEEDSMDTTLNFDLIFSEDSEELVL